MEKPKPFGERLKALRHRHKIHQKDLAKATGIAQSTLSAVENGKLIGLSWEHIESLAKFFNVDHSIFTVSKRGKREKSVTNQEQIPAKTEPPLDLHQKLKEIIQWKEKGLVSEEEYEILKKTLFFNQ